MSRASGVFYHSWSPARGMFFGADEHGGSGWDPYAYDMKTGRTERLDAFKATVTRIGALRPAGMSVLLSPDGRWLLWGRTSLARDEFYVVALDGTESFAWKNQHGWKNYEPTWLGDSSGWVLLERKWNQGMTIPRISLHELRRPETTAVIDVSKLKLMPYVSGSQPGRKFLTSNIQGTELTEIDLSSKTPTVRRMRMPARSTLDASMLTPSPEGNRLAWCVASPIERPRWRAFAWIHERLHPGDTRVDLFVTRLDGSSRVSLGSLDISISMHGGDNASPFGWTADGKNFLFLRGSWGEEEVVSVAVPDQ